MWMVRAGEGGYLFDDFQKKEIIAIGWNELGNLSKFSDSEEIKEKFKQTYTDVKKTYIPIAVSQISKFRFDFKRGDKVVTYNPEERRYFVGEITGDYNYNKSLCEYFHIRQVKWFGDVSRDRLSTKTKNTLGAWTTIFEVNEEAMQEISGQLDKEEVPLLSEVTAESSEELELDSLKKDIESKAHEFIKDEVMKLSWEDMQILVAGILRSMGYKTRVSPKGSDRGKDVQASRDGLGLEEPRIIVEVKHRKGQTGTKDIRNFIGVLRSGHKGLYVSTSGFSKEAHYEAERSTVPLTLIDIDELVELLVQNYDNFDNEARALIPLTKFYWPK